MYYLCVSVKDEFIELFELFVGTDTQDEAEQLPEAEHQAAAPANDRRSTKARMIAQARYETRYCYPTFGVYDDVTALFGAKEISLLRRDHPDGLDVKVEAVRCKEAPRSESQKAG